MLCVLTALHVFSQVIFGPMFSGKRWAFYPQAWKQHRSEITLLKCLFSAVYSFNTFFHFCLSNSAEFLSSRQIRSSVFPFTVCVQSAAWWHICADFILSQINLNVILTSDVNKHIVICVFCFCLSFNVPLLWHRASRNVTASSYLSGVYEQNNSKLWTDFNEIVRKCW